MANGKFVAYYRVSTKRQGESALGLKAQQKAVHDYLNGGDWSVVKEFTEIESGKNDDRKQLLAALEYCKITNSKLCISKLCRLSRSVSFLAALMDSGVEFVCCDNPNANRLTIHILAAMAEQERTEISNRTKIALAQSTKRLGTNNLPESSHETAERARKARITKADVDAEVYRDILTPIACNGLRDIARELNEKGITTTKGGIWYANSVKRVLSRLGFS
jgi:DNA invertase Pin-like site-specific DNA recombinase